MNIGIVVFPGSNCDKDCFYAMNSILGENAYYLWHNDVEIPKKTDMIILPGGFSYGDYLRAGAIARFAHMMDAVVEFAAKGKLVLGICNGFQILTESQMLPGTLTRNNNLKFICDDVYLRVENNQTAFTHKLVKNQVLKVPIAHGQGNYFIDPEGLKKLIQNQQIVFKYSSPIGEVSEKTNPNGSIENIAGIINEKGNILGMMPHPERAVEPLLGSMDGFGILASAIESLKG